MNNITANQSTSNNIIAAQHPLMQQMLSTPTIATKQSTNDKCESIDDIKSIETSRPIDTNDNNSATRYGI